MVPRRVGPWETTLRVAKYTWLRSRVKSAAYFVSDIEPNNVDRELAGSPMGPTVSVGRSIFARLLNPMTIHNFVRRHRTGCSAAAVLTLFLCGIAVTGGMFASAQQGRRGQGGQAAVGAAQQQSTPDAEHGGEDTAAPVVAPGGQGGRGGLVAYPNRPTAPQEVLDRGKAVYSTNCAFCHGSDAGGGSVGPNLHRSEVVLLDKQGELILPIVQGARADRGMPKIDVTPAQVADIAAWLHSYRVTSRGGHDEKINIVVGDAAQGKPAFDRLCASCHSVTGDLQGFAAKFTDPRAMQQAWIMPGGGGGRGPGGPGGPGGGAAAPPSKVPPTTATVTPANGAPITGRLDAVDDFYVSVTTDDGVAHRFTRINDLPKVEIRDPLAPHREMLRKYNDKDIHDITAYLESLK